MAVQLPSTVVAQDIDLGNAILYYCDTTFTSFSNAKSSTKWRKMGLLKDGSNLNFTKESIEVFSGIPAKSQAEFFIREDFNITAAIQELSPSNVARILGGLALTDTVKSSSPAATTVATGSTKSVINVASSSGYKVGDEIRVGNVGSYQFGRIASINGNAITLYEGLSGDASPTTGHAVARIDTREFTIGSVGAPANISFKVSKTGVGGTWNQDIYICKASFDANTSLGFADGSANADTVGMPFTLKAKSDPAIESGNLALWVWTMQ